MKQQADRILIGTEIFKYAVNNEGAVRHHGLDHHAIVAVGQAPDFDRLRARAKELECTLSERLPFPWGKQLDGIGRQSREQTLGKNSQDPRCFVSSCRTGWLFWVIGIQDYNHR